MNQSLLVRTALACVMGDMNMVRALGMGGIGCAVVTQPGDLVLHSRYTNQALYWEDFENGGEVFFPQALDHGEQLRLVERARHVGRHHPVRRNSRASYRCVARGRGVAGCG